MIDELTYSDLLALANERLLLQEVLLVFGRGIEAHVGHMHRRVEVHSQSLIANSIGFCCKEALPVFLHKSLQWREVGDDQMDAHVELIPAKEQGICQVFLHDGASRFDFLDGPLQSLIAALPHTDAGTPILVAWLPNPKGTLVGINFA